MILAGGGSPCERRVQISAESCFAIDKNRSGEERDVANTITAREDRGVSEQKQTGTAVVLKIRGGLPKMYDDYNGRMREDEVSCTLTPNTGSSTERNGQKVVLPVLTPDRIEKRQNGRRFKENGDPAFTLTSEDRHGVAIGVQMSGNELSENDGTASCLNTNDQRKIFGANQERTMVGVLRAVRSEYGKEIRKDYESGNFNISRHKFLEHEIREDGVANTIDSVVKDNLSGIGMGNHGTVNEEHQGMYVELPNGAVVYAVWYPKYECYVAIRKLTPRECFRLQGWTDDYFDKAELVNSDSQLYKQAGNGVTVNVVEVIGKRLREIEEDDGR